MYLYKKKPSPRHTTKTSQFGYFYRLPALCKIFFFIILLSLNQNFQSSEDVLYAGLIFDNVENFNFSNLCVYPYEWLNNNEKSAILTG